MSALLTLAAAAAFICASPRVIDGDTIACKATHVRLTGIDAPEMPGHCRKGRLCVKGNPHRSKASLQSAITGRVVWVTPTGFDRYHRTLGIARAGTLNLACHQLARRAAIYVAKWDDGGRIKRECER